MNWLQKTSQISEINPIDIGQWDSLYPRAGGSVSGLAVNQGIVPNTDSISAGIDDWHELPGIREVPMSEFGSAKPHDTFYAADDIQRSRELAEEIRSSGWIDPLIIGINNEIGPYILEGLHRFVALGILGVASFPALVVVDLD